MSEAPFGKRPFGHGPFGGPFPAEDEAPYPYEDNCRLLLNDGSSFVLLNDGVGVIVLNDDSCAGGGDVVGRGLLDSLLLHSRSLVRA